MATILGLAACGDSEEKLERAKNELRQAGQVASEALHERMQERLETWRADLAELDAELEDWKQKAREQSATAGAEAKQKLQTTIDELEAKRQKLAEKLSVASKASGAAWDEIVAGFENGWAELKAGLEDAKESTK